MIRKINETYSRIIDGLGRKEVKNALDDLQGMIAIANLYDFQDKLNELQETYKYMLRYRMEGIQDPMQGQIYKQIQASAYELADQVKQRALDSCSPLSFYRCRHSLKKQPPLSYEALRRRLLDNPNDPARIYLFSKIWTSGFLTLEEAGGIRDILRDERLSFIVACQVVSALLLGLEEAFDKEKLLLLLEAAESRQEEVSVRALVALLVTLYKYRKRTALYPQIEHRLHALAEVCPTFPRTIQTITLRFILARETEKITRKLQDEIIPEMLKLNPSLGKKINLKDLTSELPGNEMNPEWQDALFSNKELNDKMAEFGELQKEGADVLHSTFIHLKNYPFFRELSNWFLPFSPRCLPIDLNSPVQKSELEMIDMMSAASFMCNSDKYSLYFSIRQLQEEMRPIMPQPNEQITEMIEQGKEDILEKRPNQELITGRYIQDLYRFYKLYPDRKDFDDIFTYPLDFHNLEILKPYISDATSLTTIAECYLRKNYYQDAFVIYQRLLKKNPEEEVLHQKSGYCRQMNGDTEGALADYLQADLLNPQSTWVIRRIAGCYRTLKQPEKALEYYRRHEALSPDDLSVQISIGNCYLELKDYDEALKYFYKVDYLDTKRHRAWRPIAWCSFLTGRYDHARNYYKKILEHRPNMQDYLNAGHTEWALQNMKLALQYYREAVRLEKGDWAKFHEQFEQDIPDLERAGIEEEEIPLVLDQLRYLL